MQRGFTLLEALIVVAIVAILALVLYSPSATCAKQAEKMGMKHDWDFMQGCMIEVKPGQWVRH